jgi:TRAP-type C4-dicarboxylate transport system substrate-binding protein
MKLKNIFKKGTQEVSNATIQKLDKNQLDKIVGGATEVIDPADAEAARSRTTKVYEQAKDND